MVETGGESLETGQGLSSDRLPELYRDLELRAAARASESTWGDKETKEKSQRYYLQVAAGRGLNPEEAMAILPILNSGRSPAES